MKIYFLWLLLLALLLSAVFASSDLLLDTDTTGEDDESNVHDPEFVKQQFILSVTKGQVSECQYYVGKYEFLTRHFNRNIFGALLDCFEELYENSDSCWEIFDLIKPSFADVSRSTSTPLILALRRNRMELFTALINLQSVHDTIDIEDEFARTALMYAAKRGSYNAVKMIIDLSTASINYRDFLGKSVLHYACEMNSISVGIEQPLDVNFDILPLISGNSVIDASNKAIIFFMLVANGANIEIHDPEFKLNFQDQYLKYFIRANGGKVSMVKKIDEIISTAAIGVAMLQAANSFGLSGTLKTVGAKLISVFLANPFLMAINEICFRIQKMILPDVDLNLVVSFDLGDRFQDFSFNILFVMLMAPIISKIISGINLPNPFKL